KIGIPNLLITAQDDPFVPYEAIRASRAERNRYVTFNAPKYGGHCAFISNESGTERFWAESRIADFCEVLGGKRGNKVPCLHPCVFSSETWKPGVSSFAGPSSAITIKSSQRKPNSPGT